MIRNKTRKEKTKTHFKKENDRESKMTMAAQEANLFAQDLIQAFQNIELPKKPIRNHWQAWNIVNKEYLDAKSMGVEAILYESNSE